ncbi:autoinducer binding domain-containing protein [Pantoea sp. B65]|uniref:helix-turn-helix transcriptional regulator n=1 Tax=Pantoea sp. B65 TaxID=2813359 RepID=UPI0039B3B69A
MNKDFFSDTAKNNYIKEYLEKQLARYGKMHYAFSIMDKEDIDKILVISDLKDYFTDIYLRNKFQSIDPVIINTLNRVSPLVWDENLMISSQWTIIFNSVAPYNIISGQTFVLHDHNDNLALLSLYINKLLMVDIDDNVKKHKNDLQGLLINIHEMLFSLYREDQKNNSAKIDKNIFSPRESEILYWCSIGKTYPEISHILNISVSTVKFHMGNIVKKLGVNNAKHAISLGSELRLVSAPPVKKTN